MSTDEYKNIINLAIYEYDVKVHTYPDNQWRLLSKNHSKSDMSCRENERIATMKQINIDRNIKMVSKQKK